ncbi:hypothetical protein PR048_005056 [Dryococelus australis]|uniref:Uncharacterized protein n=1 Tax=Dryococelus australis TaxID=614101 RepID=A0ABQ9I814_9NEOP|nr:hypothetical protein PR048_005056 [Dryococelus australis]
MICDYACRYNHIVDRQALTASFELAVLPPTKAALYHSLRTFIQTDPTVHSDPPAKDWPPKIAVINVGRQVYLQRLLGGLSVGYYTGWDETHLTRAGAVRVLQAFSDYDTCAVIFTLSRLLGADIRRENDN